MTSQPLGLKRGNSPGFRSSLILAYFILIFSLIEISTLAQKSPTADEPLHLFSGYSYLKWGDFRANPVHPPFAKMWAALPLLAFDIDDPRPSSPQWQTLRGGSEDWPLVDLARRMFFVGNDGELFFYCAKLQMIILAIFLGIAVYLWSKRLFGIEAATTALFIFALDPNILAHSQVIHTDIPLATFFFIGSCFFWRSLDECTWPNLGLVAVCFGLAAITKYTYLMIIPAWLILGLAKVASVEPQRVLLGDPRIVTSRWGKFLVLAMILGAAGVTAYLFIWAAYGFRFDAIPGGQQPLPMNSMMSATELPLRYLVEFVARHGLFPEAWIYGQLFVFKYLGRAAFLLGEVSDGFWSYFPVAFLVKTPLPTLVLIAAGTLLLIGGRIDRRVGFFLLIPALICFLLAVLSRMNIGVRHILPIYPFLFVFAGGVAAELWRSGSRIKKYGLIALGLWYAGSCIWTYPHYLAYFNELVGGPRNGHKVLLDSNLDWGQDLKGLKHWMDDHKVKRVKFLYFGTVDPEYYGIDASYIPGSWVNLDPPATQLDQAPSYIAISAHLLYGPWRGKNVELYQSKKPVVTIGHSIFVFEIENQRSQ